MDDAELRALARRVDEIEAKTANTPLRTTTGGGGSANSEPVWLQYSGS